MTGALKRTTTNYNIPVPKFDETTWQGFYEQGVDIIDAAIFAFTGININQGVWDNATVYAVNDRAVDADNGTLWSCLVGHTSASSGTFAADRTANSSYWEQVTSAAVNGGTWTTSTAYTTNTYIEDGYRVGIVTNDYTSGASYNADVSNGDIVTLVDLTSQVSPITAISDEITTVAGIDTEITTVAGDSADIQTLAAITAQIGAVAAIDTDISTVAADTVDIGTVSTNIASVITCATNIADIQDAANLFGNVVQGPGSSTNNYIPQWDGTGGDTLKAGLAVGTSANNLVQLDGSSRLPAVDGSQLTNLDTGGMTQIGSPVVISSPVTSVEFTSISSDYDHLYIVFEDVSHNAGVNTSLRMQISADNGSTYSNSSIPITSDVGNTISIGGGLVIFGYNKDFGGALIGVDATYSDPEFNTTNDNGYRWHATGGIDAIRINSGSGSLDAGTITLYGY
jgi:hypothetical protein